MSARRLEGKVVAITGAARGIGLATARALAALGARVSIGDLDAALAAEAAASIDGHSAALDVRDRASFDAFLESTRAALGPVDILINNAGIMPMGAFESEDDAITDAQIDINLRGVIHGMKLALPEMRARRTGHIVNVASLAGRFPIPGASVYCGTKFAVIGMTESLRGELRGSGVHLTVVMPSRVSTELSSGTGSSFGLPTASPEEVAEAIVFALQHRLTEVTAPRYMKPLPGLFAITPRWLEEGMRRLINDDRILTSLDRKARAAYEQRLNSLTPDGKKPSRQRA